MTEGGRSRRWWARPAGLVTIGVVFALAVGGTVWAVTSGTGGNNAAPTQPTMPQGSVDTTTTAPPGVSSTAPGVVTPTTPTTGDTVRVPDVVTGTVVSAAELTLQGVRLQFMLETQPVGACTLPSGAYNQNAVLWQTPAAGSVVPVGSEVSLGVC
ncbi:MAG TPA: PASTA domain-containing protein [Acidimicrobiales bacterium]|nr:PASTA domain-containing protein [Acidimicrobiales bacterium]